MYKNVHFVFRGRFGVRRNGWEDGLRATSANFFINKNELANRKKNVHANCPPKNKEQD
jgi:hypothetical protein